MSWSKELTNKLIELYPNTKNSEISIILNISKKSIESKANRLKLKKSKEFKSHLIGIRNKLVGRDLSYDNLIEIARKYKSRGEFQKCDGSAYSSAQKKGLLDDICSHMVSKSFSIPQLILNDIITKLFNCDVLYNTRKIIKPYELDVYVDNLKIAFEYNGKGWHKDNDNSFKYELCNKLGILLIIINENNRKYEYDIKEQIINHLPKINNFLKKEIKADEINHIIIGDVYSKVLCIDDLYKIASKYKNKKEFRENNSGTYQKLYKLGLLNLSTKYFIK
jgi:hypothetical protein